MLPWNQPLTCPARDLRSSPIARRTRCTADYLPHSQASKLREKSVASRKIPAGGAGHSRAPDRLPDWYAVDSATRPNLQLVRNMRRENYCKPAVWRQNLVTQSGNDQIVSFHGHDSSSQHWHANRIDTENRICKEA
eukprot:753841-Hanusia_phi.AAC.2